jgi:hypothetical protein
MDGNALNSPAQRRHRPAKIHNCETIGQCPTSNYPASDMRAESIAKDVMAAADAIGLQIHVFVPAAVKI